MKKQDHGDEEEPPLAYLTICVVVGAYDAPRAIKLIHGVRSSSIGFQSTIERIFYRLKPYL